MLHVFFCPLQTVIIPKHHTFLIFALLVQFISFFAVKYDDELDNCIIKKSDRKNLMSVRDNIEIVAVLLASVTLFVLLPISKDIQ